MNARQMKKRLKKQIDKIQSDNRLMRNIIADSPTMQELYDAYNKPLNNVAHTTMQFQEFRAERMIPISRANDREIIKYIKLKVAEDLFEFIKDDITYEINEENELTSITGSIFIGRKER